MKVFFKSIFFFVFIFYINLSAQAQTNGVKNFFKMTPNDFSTTIGAYGTAYLPHTEYNGVGFGGGGGVRVKYNFNQYLGIISDIGYTYSKGMPVYKYSYIYTRNAHLFDIRLMLLLQREIKYNETGFAPWFGLGPVISVGYFTNEKSRLFNTSKINTSISGSDFGFIVGFGLRYNFKKIYTGINYDYTIAEPSDIDMSSMRLNIEVGYRF